MGQRQGTQNLDAGRSRRSRWLPALLGASLTAALASTLAIPEWENYQAGQARQMQSVTAIQKELNQLRQGQARLQQKWQGQSATLQRQVQALENRLEHLTGDVAGAQSTQQNLLQDMTGLRQEIHTQAAALASQTSKQHLVERRRKLRTQILEPVIQLTGVDAVGSAVLVYRGEDSQGAYYLALTSYHVIRDILSERTEVTDIYQENIETVIERDSGNIHLMSKLVAENVAKDLGLLRLDTEADLGPVARLAPLQRNREVQVFTPVYTVGCPLGTTAQATRGEITRSQWQVEGHNFWMLSSPAYFGNSGGGVFLADSLELIGIFAKIYTHGSFRPQVITHMGLAVPLEVLHQWLKEGGYGFILPSGETQPATAALSPEVHH